MTGPELEQPLLRAEGLRVEFDHADGTIVPVQDVSLTLHRGERVGLVGESGSGKSTFALALMGLLRPPGRVAAGNLWLDGEEMDDRAEADWRARRGRMVSLIFQDPGTALDPVKRVGHQIAEALLTHDAGMRPAVVRSRVVELLRRVGIRQPDQRIMDYPHQFSGGMRQRVMIAMAIANDPAVIIADEPTAALDVTTQAEILKLLDGITRETGAAVLFITHDLALVAEFCGSVQVMYGGRIVEAGPTGEILAAPVHPYTSALIQAIPRMARQRRLVSIPGSPPDPSRVPPGCPFEPRCALGRGHAICLAEMPPLLPVAPLAGRDRTAGVAACHLVDHVPNGAATR